MDRTPPFFRPGGTMDPAAPSYIARAADARLLEALLAGEYVFVLDSRQKGKSSMVARTIVTLKGAGVQAVKLDLQRIGANVTPEQWYAGLLTGIGQELGLFTEVFAYWSTHQAVGPLARWLGAIESVVLPSLDSPLVVFVDEIDFVRALPFPTDEFFGGVRDCYNRRTNGAGFDKLTFCLVGVATPAQLVRNPEITPFNIGIRLNLSDFTREETGSYEVALNTPNRSGAVLLDRVHHWVNGHPYLTQLLCSRLAGDETLTTAKDVDRLVQELFLSPDARQSEPNFTDVERRMLEPDIPGMTPEERKIQVLELYGRMLKGKPVEGAEENPVVATLRLSGVGQDEGGTLRVRNRTYRLVFDEQWRRQRLPDAELRRQQGAARVAVLRTAVVAGIVVLALSSAAFGMWRLSNDRQRSLTTLQQRTDELNKVSNQRQAALTALETKSEELNKTAEEREKSLADLERQSEELKKTSEQRLQALFNLERRTDELLRQTYFGRMASIQNEMAADRWTRLSELVSLLQENPNRGWEWGHLALTVDHGGRTLDFPAWSRLEPQPDGSVLVASLDGMYAFGAGPPRRVQRIAPDPSFTPKFRQGPYRVRMIEATRGDAVFDVASERRLVKNRTYSMIYDVDPKRGLYLLFVGQKNARVVELRRIADDGLVASTTGPEQANAGKFLPDGTYLCIFATPNERQAVVLHLDQKGKVLDSAPSNQWYARDLVLSPDSSRYAAYGYDEKVEIRKVRGHTKLSELPAHPRKVTDLVFSRDGKRVLTGCGDGLVRLFEVETGTLLRTFVGHRGPIHSVAFLDKGWASIDEGGTLRVWSAASRPAVDLFHDHTRFASLANIDVDGRWLVSSAYDGTVASRDLVTGKVVRRRVTPDERIPLLTRGNGFPDLFLVKGDGTIERLSRADLKTKQSVKPFDSTINFLNVLPTGKRLFLARPGQRFALLDPATLRVVARIEPKLVRKPVDSTGVPIQSTFAYDPRGEYVALFLGEVGEIQVYSQLDGMLVKRWNPGTTVLNMAFVDGGRQLVASLAAAWYARDARTVVFDTRTGKRVGALEHPGKALADFRYSPVTERLATRVGGGMGLILWDMRSRKKIAEVVPGSHTDDRGFLLSPDGERLVTSSDDQVIRVWDSRTGEPLYASQAPKDGTLWRWPRFSADGKKLILVDFAGAVKIWNSLAWE